MGGAHRRIRGSMHWFREIWNQALHDRTSFLVGMAESEEKEKTKQFTLAVVCIPFTVIGNLKRLLAT